MPVTFEKPNEIKSVAGLAKRASEINEARLLFRGQNTDKPLKPKTARQRDFDAGVQQEMLERFKKESGPFLGGVSPQTDWDWLSVAQHQAMSTRLTGQEETFVRCVAKTLRRPVHSANGHSTDQSQRRIDGLMPR